MNEITKTLYNKLISKDLWKRVIAQLRLVNKEKPRSDDYVAIILSIIVFLGAAFILSTLLKTATNFVKYLLK